MKRFDSDAIYSRVIERIRMSEDWAQILDKGTIASVSKSYAEELAELARYLEHAYTEKKWKTARDTSSLVAEGDLIGRKLNRAKSATGYVIVSHTDEEGVNRLANYGKYFFSLDDASNYDDIAKSATYTVSESKALVPWVCNDVYSIPQYTRFITNSSVEFIATESVQSRILKEPFSTIKSDDSKYSEFLAAGGWSGIKYLRVPVIQGIRQTADMGYSDGTRFQTFTFSGNSIENAKSSISKPFFNISVTLASGTVETWEEINNIRLASPYDKVFSSQLSADSSSVLIKFGDGITGYIPPSGSKITLNYLETLGASGNVSEKYSVTSMILPGSEKQTDPRTNAISTFLYCTNTNALSGGTDIEDASDFKAAAPSSYLESYATATKDAFKEQIMSNSPVTLLTLKTNTASAEVTEAKYDSTIDETEGVNTLVANEFTTVSNTLEVTAIKANGEKIDDAENTFIKPVLKALATKKGVSDGLSYVEPNFIRMAPSIIVRSTDYNTPESTMKTYIKESILSKYAVSSTTFDLPLYDSEIISSSKMYSWADSITLLDETLATVSCGESDIAVIDKTGKSATAGSTDSELLSAYESGFVAIPFSFDACFMQNSYDKGFKNANSQSQYVIKVDFNFINRPSYTSKSRTFFLYDNRTDTSVSLNDAKRLVIDSSGAYPHLADKYGDYKSATVGHIYTFDETREGFNNRQVRVAQFSKIDKITDDVFMAKAKSFTLEPFEKRPYVVDEAGNNKIFTTALIDSSLAVGIGSATAGKYCYKKNTDYIDGVDIIFNENYDASTPAAAGYIVMPVSYLELDFSSADSTTFASMLSAYLSSNFDIKVYAQPVIKDVEPKNWNDIVFVDADDIKVEKRTIS